MRQLNSSILNAKPLDFSQFPIRKNLPLIHKINSTYDITNFDNQKCFDLAKKIMRRDSDFRLSTGQTADESKIWQQAISLTAEYPAYDYLTKKFPDRMVSPPDHHYYRKSELGCKPDLSILIGEEAVSVSVKTCVKPYTTDYHTERVYPGLLEDLPTEFETDEYIYYPCQNYHTKSNPHELVILCRYDEDWQTGQETITLKWSVNSKVLKPFYIWSHRQRHLMVVQEKDIQWIYDNQDQVKDFITYK